MATVYRFLREAVDLLAARAPSLTAALWVLAWSFNTVAILDETVVRTDRLGGASNRRYYCGQHHHHGVNLQGLTDPSGRLTWISTGLPGSVHDLAAAHAHEVFTSINRAGPCLCTDKGYASGEADLLLVPYKGRQLSASYTDANKVYSAIRSRGERGFATLKAWKILTHVRARPRRVSPLAQAIPTLKMKDEKGSIHPIPTLS